MQHNEQNQPMFNKNTYVSSKYSRQKPLISSKVCGHDGGDDMKENESTKPSISSNNVEFESIYSPDPISRKSSKYPIEVISSEWKHKFGPKYHHLFDEFEDFCEKNGFAELFNVKDDIADIEYSVIREKFFKIHNALDIFDKIKQYLKENPLKGIQMFFRAFALKNMIVEAQPVMFKELLQKMSCHSSQFKQKEHSSKLNMISHVRKIALSVFVITKYHEQSRNIGWSLSDFLNKSAVLQELNNLENKMMDKNAYKKLIRQWIVWYDQNVYKPLPKYRKQLRHSINHDINVVTQYNTQIIAALYQTQCFGVYPIQLDVFYVPALTNASAANIDAQFATFSDRHKVISANKDTEPDGNMYYGAYRLLRTSKREMAIKHGDRVVMVIVRKNQKHSNNDDIYMFVSDDSNNVAHDCASISELPWLANTKSDIIPGLNPQMHEILGVSHHVRSDEHELVYIAYEGYCSRVFENDFIRYLPVLFKGGYDTIRPVVLVQFKDIFAVFRSARNGLKADFRDLKYQKYGEYFFGSSRYEYFKPGWYHDSPRAKYNAFIPKNSTRDLMSYIAEYFKDSGALYYYLDYSFAMQYLDEGMCYYAFHKNSVKAILVINTELHNKDGKELYAICEKNDRKSKQRWKVFCFMTKEEICKKWFIHELDLPIGSKTKHNQFQFEIDQLQVNVELIKNTKLYRVRVIKSSSKYDNNNNNCSDIIRDLRESSKEVQNMIMASLGNPFIPIISFKFEKNKCYYYVEKLLLVKYSGSDNQWFAVAFKYHTDSKITEVSAICLDLLDCKNKSSLINVQNGIFFDQIMMFNKNIKSFQIVAKIEGDNKNKMCNNNGNDNNNSNSNCNNGNDHLRMVQQPIHPPMMPQITAMNSNSNQLYFANNNMQLHYQAANNAILYNNNNNTMIQPVFVVYYNVPTNPMPNNGNYPYQSQL